MTMDRRGFLYAGGLSTAAVSIAAPAHAAPVQGAKSVEELGVVPSLGRDQTAALQKAIDTIAGANQAVVLPGGAFQAGKLTLPSRCMLLGQPGLTVLTVESVATGGRAASKAGNTVISGIAFEQGSKGDGALLSIEGGIVQISQCSLSGQGDVGLKATAVSIGLHGLRIEGFAAAGAVIDLPAASEGPGLVATDCRFMDCGTGIAASIAPLSLAQCHFLNCAVGIAASGSGVVSGNIVTGARSFGLRLGSAKGSGHILAQGNLLRDCRIGIGVSASGDDIMASLNMISGAKDGAIRAFDGDRLVGPDLARQSAEAYLNLMVAGNVVR